MNEKLTDPNNVSYMSENRLTQQERVVLEKLNEAWDEYLKLPIQHPSHGREFEGHIHDLQRLVMSRVVTRQEGWVKTIREPQDWVY